MIAKAWGWGYQATSISLEMVIPGIVGLWVDQLLGTVMLFLILGVVLGMIAGMIHLVQFAREIGRPRAPSPDAKQEQESGER